MLYTYFYQTIDFQKMLKNKDHRFLVLFSSLRIRYTLLYHG